MPFRGKGALMFDLNGRIAFASTYFCDLVGVEPDKIAGMSYFDFVFPEDMDAARQLLKIDKLPEATTFRLRFRRTDGAETWTDVQKAVLQTSGGEIYAITATVTN
jgi:PAS domain S-box-containing protein